MAWWRVAVNVLLFQMGWFACLLLDGLWPLLLVALMLFGHFLFIVSPDDRVSEAKLLFIVLVVGFVMEAAYLFSGVLVASDGSMIPPLWLLSIWLLFATTFRYSLFLLRNRLVLASIFAAISAPLSYYGGANLNGDMSLHDNATFSLVVVAISWALVFPFMLKYFVTPQSSNKYSVVNT